ncbi:hypothetical protein CHLRE_09g399701v5 [Chlamydomonas reinhardtii]|uniref:Uncharacterized protein n=1 Tax=Chlamydomonas reinhardtii TaxID=3055 RepID=A0A2K3DEX7_CHLRE|nr:uncharacterized protein CHLRE_09g399701v5 [Chlamydomonas reinhardtii]PNW79072.1 hypothetical protein CHLRE_09g399701v5 [Chlamydomonas reinhardtii]
MSKKDGDAFGSEIERMLMERPMTSSRQGPPREPLPMASGLVTNTLDDLMAELGMLRGERGEGDRALGRHGTRTGPRVSDGATLSSHDMPQTQRPMTPRSSAAAAASAGGALASSISVGGGGVVLPQLGPGKAAMQLPGLSGSSGSGQAPNSPSLGASPGGLGPVRAQSPMNMRRSVAGAPGAGGGSGLLAPMSNMPTMGAPPGMLERQAQLEMRLEKMEARENQLMTLVSQLQSQVSTLSRAQQTTQQQLAAVAAAPPPSPPAISVPPAPLAALQQAAAASAAAGKSNSRTNSPAPVARMAAGEAATAAAPAAAAPQPPTKVSDEEFIQDDDELSDDEKAGPAKPKNGAAKPAPQKPAPPAGPGPTPPAGAAPTAGTGAAARPAVGNKLVPGGGGAAEWESDMSQLRKELANLAANLVRLREQVSTIVPGGTSDISEAIAGQDQAVQQLKNNLTQIAMDVVSLHKGLSAHKQSTAQAHAQLEKSIVDLSVQSQTNVLNAMTQSAHAPGVAAQMAPNAVANALAATGGVSGSLEDSLRSAFAKPAMRAMPQFNLEAAGFMPDNSGAAAAAAAYGGGGGGMQRQQQMGGGGGGGGGLNGAWALLNSFEEQAAQEKAEQQKAAMIAHQAVAIVDAKVKQVVLHVDRHMQLVSNDVEERLRMYEQTIIRMAKQIDTVQRVMRDLEGSATNRIVVQRGGKDLDEEPAPAPQQAQQVPTQPRLTSEEMALKEQEERKDAVKANWLKAAAMAQGRFVKQEEVKKEVKTATHGYFGAPRAAQ